MGLMDLISAPLDLIGIDAGRLPFVGQLFGPSDEDKAVSQGFRDIAQHYRQLAPEIAASYNASKGQQLQALGPSALFAQGMAGGDPRFGLDMEALSQQVATPGLISGIQGGPGTEPPMVPGIFGALRPGGR